MCQWIIATRDENLVPTHIDSPRQASTHAATSMVRDHMSTSVRTNVVEPAPLVRRQFYKNATDW